MQEHEPVEAFLDAVGTIRSARAGTPETTYFPAVANPLDAAGKTFRPHGRCVPHPARGKAGISDFGLFEQAQFRRGAEARGISPAASALKLRVPPQRLHEIVRGERAIIPDTALRLSRFFGTSAEFWMTLRTNYDLALARKERGARIKAEVEVAA